MIENSFYMKAETWTAKELQNTFSSIVTVEDGYLNSSYFSWDFAHNSMYFPHHLCFRYVQGFQICFYVSPYLACFISFFVISLLISTESPSCRSVNLVAIDIAAILKKKSVRFHFRQHINLWKGV